MNGELAQLISLAINANARSQEIEIGDFWPQSSVFQHCNSVRFFVSQQRLSKPEWNLFAENPQSWIEQLCEGNAKFHLSIIHQNDGELHDYESTAFVGGGPAQAIYSDSKIGHFYWTPRWKFLTSVKKWDVEYFGVNADKKPVFQSLDVKDIAKQFSVILQKISSFSKAYNLGFLDSFGRAENALRDPDFRMDQLYLDPGPEEFLENPARRLLAAAQSAWVFGGMGSWNDGWPPEDIMVEHQQVSKDLFEVIHSACVAVVQSTIPQTRSLEL